MAIKTRFYTTRGQYAITIPADFDTLVSVEAIGAGGCSQSAGGGGGGAYAMSNTVTGLVAGGTAYVRVGTTGSTTTSQSGNSWFNTSNSQPSSATTGCLAAGGYGGGAGRLGGQSANCVGNLVYSGGNGGTGGTAGGGGGAAAGPLGPGGAGGTGSTYGGGGGGSNGGNAGSNGTTLIGGAGGAGYGNGVTLTGGGAGDNQHAGNPGTSGTGGGGGGTSGSDGGSGATGSFWTQTTNGTTAGSGGGSGGTNQNNDDDGPGPNNRGGLYGGGSGGNPNATAIIAEGAQGIVVLTYNYTVSTSSYDVTTGLKTTDPNTGNKQDLGSRYVSKSYLMDVYPNLVSGRYSSGLYGWGNNNNILGNLGATNYSSPVQTGSLSDWKQYSGTGSFTVAIKTNGTLWGWGSGSQGVLGDGTTTTKSTPIQIGTLTNWKQVSAGSDGFVVALKTDGTLWSWGNGLYGQLGGIATGAGTTVSRSSPVQVGSGTNWKFVNAGRAHVVAIKTDGTLWAWGNNYDVNYGANGQLGDGTTINKSSPVQIGSLKDWKKVMGGSTSTVAIKTDGTLWTWGAGNASFNNGQLGDGTGVGKSSPIQIGSLIDWKDIHIGGVTCYAIKTDGTLWAWGQGNSGKLGDGTVISKSSPIQVGSLTNWKKVAGGNSILAAIKTDGTLWTCGANFTGQMGDGTTTGKSSPIQIGTLTNWRQVDDLGNSFTRGILGGEI